MGKKDKMRSRPFLMVAGAVLLVAQLPTAQSVERNLRGHLPDFSTGRTFDGGDGSDGDVEESGGSSPFRFNVEVQDFGQHVMDGYSNCEDLESDVTIALKVLADQSIEEGKTRTCTWGDNYYGGGPPMFRSAPETAPMNSRQSKSISGGTGVDSFGTNNQVGGVDEADLVKANADYVYAAYSNQIIVTDTNGNVLVRKDIPQPPKQGNDDAFHPKREIRGLLLEDNVLTVMTGYYNYTEGAVLGSDFTTTFFYEFVEADSDLQLMEQMETNGSYSSARMIDGTSYIVTNSDVNTQSFTSTLDRCDDKFKGLSVEEYEEEAFRIASDTVDAYARKIVDALVEENSSCENIVQIFSMSPDQVNSNNKERGVADIWFLNDAKNAINSFVQVTSMDGSSVLTGDFEQNKAGSFLPTSSWNTNIYASNDLLAISGPGYRVANVTHEDGRIGKVASQFTFIMTFDLDGEKATPSAAGEVQGTINDQFNMDFYQDHLRIATGSASRYGLFPLEDGHSEWKMLDPSKSQVFVLEEQNNELVTIGSTDNLGVNGTLQSVRFLGVRGYVSSWQDDIPLYVLDLSDPTNPVTEGKIEVSGRLDYMHPLDDGLKLLAVGTATDEDNMQIGLQISLFDVSDPSNPYEAQTLAYETRGTSEALGNHHAFRYIPEYGKLIIPGYVYNWKNKDFFDGAWLFQIDEKSGITHAGSVAHAGVNEMTNWYCWDPARLPQRSMVFNDKLITMQSHSIIMTNDVNTLSDQMWEINLDEGRNELKNDNCSPYGSRW